MPSNKAKLTSDVATQADKFIKAAKEIECDESEERFDEALKKVARHKPKEVAQPKDENADSQSS